MPMKTIKMSLMENFTEKDDTAAIASTQLNSNIRTFIPDNYQGETAPDNNDSQKKN